LHQIHRIDPIIVEVDPVTPKSVTPDPPRTERLRSDNDLGQDITVTCEVPLAQVEPLSVSPGSMKHTFVFCYENNENMLFHIFCVCFTILLVTNQRMPFFMYFWTPLMKVFCQEELRCGMLGLITANFI
jgi:hypothetical protein